MKQVKVGFALCGSFCTFQAVIQQMETLIAEGYELFPIMSDNAYRLDTRFGKAEDFVATVETICSRRIIHTIPQAEPIGPQKMFDVLVVAPCTGNTLAKLANSIVDTPVTMAVKSHLRNGRPVVSAVSTNDALSGCAQNIGKLLNKKHFYFVPMRQDNCEKKPASIVADFTRIGPAVDAALEGRQLQPLLCTQ